MKKLFLILAMFFISCSTDETDSGTTVGQCFRVTLINYNQSYIVVDINGENVVYYVQNVSDYRLNQMICNLNDIQ